jgi:coiled-coil domain-containing protein 40
MNGRQDEAGAVHADGPTDEDPANEQLFSVAMDPDDPILARTQAALKNQLVESKLRLEGELREKSKLLRDAQKHREITGVELFNFQQQLARLQMDLEKAHDNHTNIASLKEKATAKVLELQVEHEQELRLVKDERIRADKFQEELDRYCSIVNLPE